MRKHHITNTVAIRSAFVQDILINIYYVSDNKCEIVTRQVDHSPVLESLTLAIDGIEFTIDPRNVTTEVNTSFLIGKEDDGDSPSQIIPKVIFQTSESYQPTHAMYSMQDFNPEYEYKFFDDTQRREFLKNAYSQKILDAYDMLVPGAFRADLFRYAYLFIHGGCYFDDKIICRKRLRDIVRPTDELLICEDCDENSYLNSIILTKPKNFMFLKLLLSACDNIVARNMPPDMLDFTGPKLMYSVFKPFVTADNIRFKHIVVNNDFSSYKNFLIVDKNDNSALYFHKTTQRALEVFCHDTNHYRQLWNRNEILFRNKVSIYNLDVYVYPHPYVDTFKFTADRQDLTIERADCPAEWHFWLRLKILDRNTSVFEMMDVGVNTRVPLSVRTPLILPPKVYLSSELTSINIAGDVIVITSLSDYKKKDRENVIFCGIVPVEGTEYDCQIIFSASDGLYHCKENDSRTKMVYMVHSILSLIASVESNHYLKLVLADDREKLIPRKHVGLLRNNLVKLLKHKSIDLDIFLTNYSENDIPVIYSEQIDLFENHIHELNRIIQSTGELLEGNVFYDHHSQDYSINNNFENKRYNLFYQGMLAVDILEIGFNAGHSALLYLIANPYSKIHFFDLGEHDYSRKCFAYLDSVFPNRLTVTWGDSTVTVPAYPASVFDFIHIDGGHTRIVAESDFHNCRHFANPETLLMIDDYDHNCLHTFCNQLMKYNKIRKVDLLYETQYHLLCKYVI